MWLLMITFVCVFCVCVALLKNLLFCFHVDGMFFQSILIIQNIEPINITYHGIT